jgi:RNA polymerase sigma factor (sigma-70 family)
MAAIWLEMAHILINTLMALLHNSYSFALWHARKLNCSLMTIAGDMPDTFQKSISDKLPVRFFLSDFSFLVVFLPERLTNMKNDDETNSTRASLIHRLKNWRDEPSWHEFFKIYWKLIYGVARKAGLSDSEAQDVVQETLISVAKHMPTFKYDPAIGSFKSWLLNVTRWRVVDQFRKRKPSDGHKASANRSKSRTDSIDALADPNAIDPNAAWEAEWRTNLLNAAMDNLRRRIDPQKFQIFDFYVNKEWPLEKVSKRFKVSTDLVYQTKCRVTEAIRVEVSRLEKEMT